MEKKPKKYQLNRLIRTRSAIFSKNCQAYFSYEISYNKNRGFIHCRNLDSFNFQPPTKCGMGDSEEQTNGLSGCTFSPTSELNVDDNRITRKLIPENHKQHFESRPPSVFNHLQAALLIINRLRIFTSMNKNTLAKFALLATAVALSQTALASDGTINFTGDIVDAPCDVSPQAANLNVPLGKVSRTTLDGAVGKYSTPAQFELQLANCSATAKGASVTFTGVADTINTDTLAVGVGDLGYATGVAVELRDAAQKKIKLGAQSPDYTLRAGTNNLKFGAVYVSTANKVTVGPANATAQFTVNYK